MKLLLFFPLLFTLTLASNEAVQIDEEVIANVLKTLEGTKIKLEKELGEQLHSLRESDDFSASGITATVNDYVDNILVYIKDEIVRAGLDPAELEDSTLDLVPTGTIDLTSGWLQDISTIQRDGNATLGYESSTKVLSLYLPVKLSTLLVTYKYHTQILLLSIKGDLNGKIEDLTINIKLSYDYSTYQSTLEVFDITDSGRISLKFTGNDLVDWITNAMTSVVSLFLQPVIIRIVQSMIKGGLDSIVDAVNDLINSIFTP